MRLIATGRGGLSRKIGKYRLQILGNGASGIHDCRERKLDADKICLIKVGSDESWNSPRKFLPASGEPKSVVASSRHRINV